MRMRSVLLLCAAFICAQCGEAKENREQFKTTKGKPVVVSELIVRNTDCSLSSIGIPTFPQPPKHGKIEMEAGIADRPTMGPCPAAKTPVIKLVYIPSPDFTGSDEVQIDIAEQHHQTVRLYYRITVSAEAD